MGVFRKGGTVESKEEKIVESRNKGRKIPVQIIVAAVLAVVLLVGYTVLSSRNKTTYTDVLDKIILNELGSFRYEFDVQVSDKNAVDGSETENGWTNADGTVEDEWENPAYKIIFEGIVTSVEPYTAQIDVQLATEGFNDRLTSIISYEENYYIDIEQMQYWLKSSKDSYMQSLGKRLPEGTKYLLIPHDKLRVYSGYAESDEMGESGFRSLRDITRLITSNYRVNVKRIKAFNSDGMTISVPDASSFMYTLASGMGKNYTDVISDLKTYGHLSDERVQQLRNEVDNVIDATKGLSGIAVADGFGVSSLSGNAREYKSQSGNSVLEADFQLKYGRGSKAVSVTGNLRRSGDRKDVLSPLGSTVTEDRLTSSTLVFDLIYDLMEYMNFTSIQLRNELKVTADNLPSHVKKDLINYLVDNGVFVSERNIDSFIDKYIGDSPVGSSQDVQRSKLLKEFMESLNSVSGGFVIEKEVIVQEDAPKYPEFVYDSSDMYIKGTLNIEESDTQLKCVDLLIMNKSVEPLILDITEFSMQSLLSSIYPANNLVLLRTYDTLWDVDKSQQLVEIGVSGYTNIKLYFVFNESGYMDLWYGDIKIGEVVAY